MEWEGPQLRPWPLREDMALVSYSTGFWCVFTAMCMCTLCRYSTAQRVCVHRYSTAHHVEPKDEYPGAKVRVRRGIARKLPHSRHATPLFHELTRRAWLHDKAQFHTIVRKNN